MSKLTLQYEGIVLKEYALGTGVTIGRLPDNAVIIDNPAVSGHHARVYPDGNQVILEDLHSTNGTFVNGRPITRQVLQHGDELLVGKHQLVFDRTAAGAQPVSTTPMEGLGDTVYLDTKQHRALRATLESARVEAAKSITPRPVSSAPPALRGWFKPSVAVAIARSGNTYIATALGGKPLVNDERLEGRHDLQDGDLLSVSGLVLEFRWKDAERAESAA